MEILKHFNENHDAFYVHNVLCKYNTMLPLHHFLGPQGDVNLVMYNDSVMMMEKSSSTTMAVIPLYFKKEEDLHHALTEYANSVLNELETDLLPSDCNAQTFRSVMYLPLFRSAPPGYELTAPRTSITVFGTPLHTVMSEWTRTFTMLPDGYMMDNEPDLDIVLPTMQHQLCPMDVLDNVLSHYFNDDA